MIWFLKIKRFNNFHRARCAGEKCAAPAA